MNIDLMSISGHKLYGPKGNFLFYYNSVLQKSNYLKLIHICISILFVKESGLCMLEGDREYE